MASIDDLFKKPYTPSQKRKLDTSKHPNELYKAIRSNGSASVRSNGQATVEDEAEGSDEEVAGPELPPDLEEQEDDQEGRFFGGGITNDTAEVLDFIDERDLAGTAKTEKVDSAWIRKVALNFEKKISKNAELRAKFEGEPQKFMGSEADLDADIKALSILSEHPNLYTEFAELGCVSSLVSLLSHENTDIAIDAIEIISELTDEDVEADQSQWDSLVDSMLDVDLLDLLYQNIARFDEDIESDRTGIYHTLGVLENLSSKTSIAELVGNHKSIIRWLISRAQKKEPVVSQNKQYSAEVLAVLLQTSEPNRKRFIDLDGIDTFLQLLATYRKRDPIKGTEEEEYVENIFDSVTCTVDHPAGKTKFLDAEGIELCLIMLKEGKMARPRALRLLDHSLSGVSGAACCVHLVEAAGLKILFTMFMKKQDTASTEHLLGLFASLLRSLPGDSASRIRLLAKFVENDYAKIARLLALRRETAARLAAVDRAIADEKTSEGTEEHEELADGWLSRRMDAGLFSLQMVDVVLAWLVAEDDGARARIVEGLGERDEGLGDVRKTLEEQLEGMMEDVEDGGVVDGEGGEEGGMKDILSTLVGFLQ